MYNKSKINLELTKSIYQKMLKGLKATSKDFPDLPASLEFFRRKKIKFSSVQNPGEGISKTYFMSEVDKAINKQSFGNKI